MTLELVLLLVLVADIGFVAGCAWNGRAYDRGRADGRNEARP
jgi:hypothetical protein